MRVRLAFQQAIDERFLVLLEALRGTFTGGQGTFSITAFEDENDFIQQVVMAELRHEDTVSIIAGVLLTLSKRGSIDHWTPLTLKPEELARLGLTSSGPHRTISPPKTSSEVADLHSVMMQTPTPFVVMTGPEHRFTFCNPAYAELMRRVDADSIIGKTAREVLPELVGQPFFSLLDGVYRSGEEYIGSEIQASLRNATTGEMEMHYFDFIYYPVRDAEGAVCGIMAQATDVTENVLTRQVSESREEQLYKQWAELETIYRYSPMAMCLIDAKEFRIFRLNALAAEQLGGRAEDLIGRPITEILPDSQELDDLYYRVMKGEAIRNEELTLELPPTSGMKHTFLLTLSPLFDEEGNVEMIEAIGVEINDRVDTGMRRRFTDMFHLKDAETLPHA